HRLALGETYSKIARDFHLSKDAVRRHWEHHCDQPRVVAKAHRRDRVADLPTVLSHAEISGVAPLFVVDRQGQIYVTEFDKAKAAGDAVGRDLADKRLFAWTQLKFQMITPLRQVAQTTINNVAIGASAAGDFGQLLQQIEQRLASQPPEKRGEI